MRRPFIILIISLILSACEAEPGATVTPTRSLSAPTLAPSPTVLIRSSDELYSDDEGLFIGQSNPTIAALPVDSDLPPVISGTLAPDGSALVEVVLEDGSVLLGDLYEAGFTRKPGILIVTGDRAAWGIVPLELQNAGFTVLVMEYGLVPQAKSVQTMLHTFITLGSVDPARIGVIGEAQGADIAMLACAVDEICDVVALLSPLSRDTLLNIIPSYGVRPILIATSNADAESYPAALALTQTAQGDTQFIEVNGGRGAGLLQFRPELGGELISWFSQYLGQ